MWKNSFFESKRIGILDSREDTETKKGDTTVG